MTISGMRDKIKKPAQTAGSILFWIAVWHIAAKAANQKLILKIPCPIDTLKAFFQNCREPEFWQITGISIAHILIGFLLAVIIGCLFGMLSNRIELLGTFLSPVLHLIRTVPVAALIIVAWLWIPSYALPSFIAFLMVLPIIWSHTEAGLKAVDTKLIEMAQVNGMSKHDISLKIRLPLVAPHIRTGCLTGVGIAWKAGVAAEIIASPAGTLGAMLSSAKASIDYSSVFAVTLTIVILSVFIENILKLIWKEKKYA